MPIMNILNAFLKKKTLILLLNFTTIRIFSKAYESKHEDLAHTLKCFTIQGVPSINYYQ